MSLNPIGQGEFVLSKLRQHMRNLVASAELSNHILHYLVNTRIASMLLESLEQVELGVLLNLNVEIIEGTDRSVASKEVIWTWTKANDLQVLQTHDSASNRQELMNQFSAVSSVTHRLLWDVGTGLADIQSLAGVQHTTISVATTINQVVLCLLSGSTEHRWALEPIGYHCLRNLGTEVAKIYAKGVASSLLHILKSLLSVNFTLYNTDRTLVDIGVAELLYILGDNGLTAVNSQ